MDYVIKKSKKKYQIIDFTLDFEGYAFAPKKSLKVDEIIVYDQKLIEKILNIKFNESFKKIANLVFKITTDDETDTGDIMMVIGEISRLKSVVLNKYIKYLKANMYKTMLKKIELIENQLKRKLINQRFLQQNTEKEKGHSR